MPLKNDQAGKYRVLNNIRSALSTVIVIGEIPFGQHQIVCRFMKRTSQNEPPTPTYDFIWNPDPTCWPNSELNIYIYIYIYGKGGFSFFNQFLYHKKSTVIFKVISITIVLLIYSL